MTAALEVPSHIPRPSYVGQADPPVQAQELQIQDEAGIQGMRAAGQLAARIRDFAGTFVEVRASPDCTLEKFNVARNTRNKSWNSDLHKTYSRRSC